MRNWSNSGIRPSNPYRHRQCQCRVDYSIYHTLALNKLCTLKIRLLWYQRVGLRFSTCWFPHLNTLQWFIHQDNHSTFFREVHDAYHRTTVPPYHLQNSLWETIEWNQLYIIYIIIIYYYNIYNIKFLSHFILKNTNGTLVRWYADTVPVVLVKLIK